MTSVEIEAAARQAIQELAPLAVIRSHNASAWASITFAGSRHRLNLRFEGPEAIAQGEEFIPSLPETEFEIPGQVVADAAVMEVFPSRPDEPHTLDVSIELLLLEDPV